MATASKNGLMGQDTKVSGEMVRLMVRVSCTTLTVISTKANGSTIKLTDKESTPMPTGQGMRVSGVTTSSMVRGAKLGQTTPYTKAITMKAKRTAREN